MRISNDTEKETERTEQKNGSTNRCVRKDIREYKQLYSDNSNGFVNGSLRTQLVWLNRSKYQCFCVDESCVHKDFRKMSQTYDGRGRHRKNRTSTVSKRSV